MIKIEKLNKSFNGKQVIHELSFDVKQGEVFTFLGGNGSGKTTTIRCLLGIYRADSGLLTIAGQKYTRKMSSLIGYLPEERGLYLDSTVLDILMYFGQIKGLSAKKAKKTANEFLEDIGLTDKQNNLVKSLSSGQQQKIQLGIALINKPKLLILDEPTKGLDPVNRDLLMKILKRLNNEQNTTIVFSTHLMEEAEKIADRLVMIKNGRRQLYGGVSEVKQSFGNNQLIVEFRGQIPENKSLYKVVNQETNYAELAINQGVEASEILAFLAKNEQLKLQRFEKTTPSLREIFIQVTESNP